MLLIAASGIADPAHGAPKTEAHHAPNHNFDAAGAYLPGKAGFNLADVGDVRQLDSLPNGVRGLVWVGQCTGADAAFLKTVLPFVGKSNVFGFYLMDDPDPSGLHRARCSANALAAESDWIHAHIAGAKTFIALMTMTSSKAPSFLNTYNSGNSHVDLFGIDPYPCRSEVNGCDYDMIDRYVAAAEKSGISRREMVPIYQTFGGGKWRDDGGGEYVLPSVSQMQQILDRWTRFLPAPVFDYAYSWGSQKGDQALESAPDLQTLFAHHNDPGSP